MAERIAAILTRGGLFILITALATGLFMAYASRGYAENCVNEPTAAATIQAEAVTNQVEIIADGQSIMFPTEGGSVAEILKAANIGVFAMDRVVPALKQTVKPGEKIQVTRVSIEIKSENIVLPNKTIFLSNPKLRPGMVVKVREGRDGIYTSKIRIWKKDGVETEREELSRTWLQSKIDAIELHSNATLPSRGGLRESMTMTATAYDPGPRSCGKYADGYTSIGMKAGRGVVAVDPRVIPMRSVLYIEGYGVAIAGDVGGAIKGMRIDLGFDTYNEAIKYGRKTVKVYVLE
jgi:3D (Asp-Asp-Asp) domain-containing protein